jgi:hypothetical protein
VSDELMSSDSRERHMADASDEGSMEIGETTSAKSNLEDASLEAHAGHDDSESMSAASLDPHVETDDSMSASSDISMAAGETMSAESNIDRDSESDSDAHVGQVDSESMSVSDELMSSGSRERHMADASDEGSMEIGETTSAKSNLEDASLEAHAGHGDSESMSAASLDPHVETDDSVSASGDISMAAGETMSAESNIDRDSESDSEPMTADESHGVHVGHVDSESMSATPSSIDPHAETDESMSAPAPHEGHDSPSSGDSMPVLASDEPHTGHDASQLGHETKSADSALDGEPHVGHNAAVNRKPDNDPESSGN